MKNISIVIALLLFLVGCDHEIIHGNYTGDELRITAQIAGGSRAGFVESDGVVKVEWEENEVYQVLLYAENGKSHALYTVEKNDDGTATLVPYQRHRVIKAEEGEKIYAYFGVSIFDVFSFSGTTFSTDEESYTSCFYKNCEMYASGVVKDQQLNLTFKHAYSYLRVRLKQLGDEEADIVDDIAMQASAKTITPTRLIFDAANGEWKDDADTRKDVLWPMKVIHHDDGTSSFYFAILPQTEPVILDFMFSYADGYMCLSPEFSRVSPPNMEQGKVYDFDFSDWEQYESTDYSQDGKVKMLQQATKGKGIDLVFMGNGFVDKDWNNGIYEGRMKIEMERLFSKEPMKSLRNRFNVYMVNVVSPTSIYSYEKWPFKDQQGYSLAEEYARKAIGEEGEPRVIVVYNYNGNNRKRSFAHFDEDYFYAFICANNEHVVSHEAVGHGLGLLKDEYVVNNTIFPEGNKVFMDEEYAKSGRDANVDWRNDPETVRWAYFIKDTRYASENIGIYDGAYYSSGLYCATENSIMRNGTEFNAPSREAIYKRIMKLSEGDSWVYDYETFVNFDAPNWNK